jgi:hypothetical protein
MSVNQKHPAWLVPALVLVVLAFSAAPALAASPVLTVNTISLPTNLAPGGEGELLLQINNLGDAPANGETSPIAIAEKLPAGLVATAISGAECELETLHCVFRGILQPYTELRINITVKVETSASTAPGGLVNEVVLSGGGAAPTTTRHALTVSPTPAPFGVEDLRLVPTNEDGSIDTQAGSHPFQLTTTVALNTSFQPSHSPLCGCGEAVPHVQPVALTKDLHFSLPAGLVGNAQAIPQCTSQEFDAVLAFGVNACPAETAIGIASIRLTGQSFYTLPLYNLVPTVGEPARFGFSIIHVVPVILDTAVRTGGDYGVVVSVNNISQIRGFLGSQVTFWGVPADPSHNNLRGWGCLVKTLFNFELEPCVAPAHPRSIPFLTLPTSCSGPAGMRTTVEADSWSEPGVFTKRESLLEEIPGEPLGVVGCNRLPFEPSISVAPDGSAASTPSGLTVGVHVPQEGALNPTGLAPADVKDTTVTFPAGIQISPAGADGLEACSLGEIGLEEHADPSCPDGSKVATAEFKTPLLPNPLVGEVYLAAQNANPFGSLVAVYIVAKDPVSGVLVKVAGQVKLDPVTGQLVSTFENTPQLPWEDLTLHFFGSARAPLSTPALCGAYTTQASFTPWSGNPAATPSSSFEITSGPNGAPCSNPQPFAPGFQAGSTNLQAGAFTPFTLTMTRPDADQTLAGLSVQLPPGLSGSLAKVPLCPEPLASEGACSESSLIGHTVVSSGLGSDPFTVEGGKVFITGPYKGAPFGLSILNPAKAGPFDLGHVVVRAKIEVDATTAALHIVSDPLPTIIQGIPLQIQHVNVTVDRPEFTFNPTSCNPMKITGTMTSTEGASASVGTPFQVTNCATLAFKPKFTVSTSSKTSRRNGASLDVKLSYPATPEGTEANIAKVKVELPRALPSRLPTLQKACTAAQFESNPAGCPPESIVGHAKATTPLVPVPLEGPAYFVSHGGEAFPSLIVVLQGYGLKLDLVGSTFISKTGITSSTFKTIPDAPVGTFELTLPQGPYSALAANTDLCRGRLAMGTEFVAQNGAEIHQSTPIEVTGCKAAITVLRHSVSGKTATITVRVPSAGTLVATGPGLSRASAKARSAGTVTVKLTLSGAERRFLAKHPGRRLMVNVALRFTPRHGARLTGHTALLIG